MNGVHDMGGMHGMGPIQREENEPVFHEEWERRMFALDLAMGAWGKWNIDMSRFAREQMPPAEYLATSYYEHWLFGLEKLLAEKGLPTKEDQEKRGVLTADAVWPMLRKGGSARVAVDMPPKFKVGDRVIARNINPAGHTRLPRYARGRRGVIDRDHGVFVFPDTNALGQGKKPQHVNSVRFTARELWGDDASPRDAVYIDLWDDYLDPV